MGWFGAGSTGVRLAIRRNLMLQGSHGAKTHAFCSQNRCFCSAIFRAKAQSAATTDSFQDGISSMYIEDLQKTWEANPDSVDESWDNFFRNFSAQGEPAGTGLSRQTIQESMRLLLLVRAYQVNGHMKAKSDPLDLEERKIPEVLDISYHGFTEADLGREFYLGMLRTSGFLSDNRPVMTLQSILYRLEQTYCGSIGYEYMHILSMLLAAVLLLLLFPCFQSFAKFQDLISLLT